MDIILEQRINFSKIVAYKNYCTLDEKPELLVLNEDKRNDVIFHNSLNYSHDSITPSHRHSELYMDFRNHLPKKNTRDFYDYPENSRNYNRTRLVKEYLTTFICDSNSRSKEN